QTFNQRVLGSNPSGVTLRPNDLQSCWGVLVFRGFSAARSVVDILAMAEIQDRDDANHIFDLVNHSILPNSDSPAVSTNQLPAPGRARFLSQTPYGVSNPFVLGRREFFQ
ncbi:MAG: hypothetical protein ACI84D_003926, partial [Thalassolituus oleivorans]